MDSTSHPGRIGAHFRVTRCHTVITERASEGAESSSPHETVFGLFLRDPGTQHREGVATTQTEERARRAQPQRR